ncbi:hypothetical protein LZP73_10940 [Shewanella sp. AS16]|uniref:hypothetical protein n=1 Tax=Shewanella sp. AS16 TaxID=2907625 RepID=UPI001F42F077|nr:hypothetical protein [Shewanella sp. AS16]MCE9686722.1 hypothetical protein [Shewanella sp. AS16]
MTVELNPAAPSATLVLNGSEYGLVLNSAQQRKFAGIDTFMLQLPPQAQAQTQAQNNNPPPADQMAKLLGLGAAVEFKLPSALLALARQNGVSTEQLTQLAARPQGYPLPIASLQAQQLSFSGSTNIHLSANIRVDDGDYVAKIVFTQGSFKLSLSPLLAQTQVQLGSIATATVAETELPADAKLESQVQSKTEPAQVWGQLLKKLEQLPPSTGSTTPVANVPSKMAETQPSQTPTAATQTEAPGSSQPNTPAAKPANQGLTSDKASINRLGTEARLVPAATQTRPPLTVAGANIGLNITTNTATNTATNIATNTASPGTGINAVTAPELAAAPDTKARSQILQQALNKAGAMPRDNIGAAIKDNLAGELLKHLPRLDPLPLSILAEPSILAAEMTGLAGLSLANQPATLSSLAVNANAITTLFQLLLGVKASAAGAHISPKLENYLQHLQASSGMSRRQLEALDKAGTLDALGLLSAGQAQYQQASGEDKGSLNWYFALPYVINQRHEQLEGKFERSCGEAEDKHSNLWRLQLKFNLSHGPLLIQAQQQGERLNMQFKANDPALLDRVSNYLTPLSEKLTQLGFMPGKMTTQVTSIPATLLPGDHYLVKTQA